MNNSLYKIGILALGVILGGMAGYLYYRLVGCSSGQCAITSNPIISSLYGALIGGLIANHYQP